MENKCEFLKDLNYTQNSVCKSTENFVLTACPGSGKTRTITYRLAYLTEKYKGSKKINIAITYTNRAANEIENRLIDMGIDTCNIWTGTIHQFCMKYIIRPYSMYHKMLRKGYRIIDEYIKDEYIKVIADELGRKKFYVKKYYKDEEVMDIYEAKMMQNKEIDFDMILKYSQELLEQNDFIAQNISKIIRSIHVDEYQDTNESQYRILASIIKANNNITLLFVGDVNQAIYGNLGGVAKSIDEIRELFAIEFKEKCLDGCYRSTQRIVDYYVYYEVDKTGVCAVSEHKDEEGTIKFNSSIDKEELPNEIAEILAKEIKKGVSEEEICVVAPQWYQIYPMANKLRELLPDNNFDAPDISPIKYDSLNVFFLIAKLLFTQKNGNRLIRRKEAKEILDIFKEEYGLSISDRIDKLDILNAINSTQFINDNGIKTLEIAIKKVCNMLNIELLDNLKETKIRFFEKINNRIKEHNLLYDCHSMEKTFKEKKGIVISTIHGVKGEEYTTVIAFDLLNGHLPHWDYIYDPDLKALRYDETNKLLYVLCSRAKKNLYLFSERGRETQKKIPYETTDELSNCNFDYDE